MRAQSSKRTLAVQAKPLTAFQPGSWPGTKPKPHGREGEGRRAQEGTEEGSKQEAGRERKRSKKTGWGGVDVPRGPGSPGSQPALLPGSLPPPCWPQWGPGGQPPPKATSGWAWPGEGVVPHVRMAQRSRLTLSLGPETTRPVPAVIQGYSGPHLLGTIGGLGRAQGPVQCRDSASCNLISVCDPHAHPGTHQAGL